MTGERDSERRTLDAAARAALAFLESLPTRPVAPGGSSQQLVAELGGPLLEDGAAPEEVIEQLVRGASPGLVASAGPRYFGFVLGGTLPAALAADWLVSAWDQNASLFVTSPAAAVVEDVVASWLLDLLGLPRDASVGFVTGTQMATFTGLAAARHAVLQRVGWDVEGDGLRGAPPMRVLVGEHAHVTVLAALRMLGLGTRDVVRVAADGQGRMRTTELRRVLEAGTGPTVVCAQAGDVDTGAVDPLADIAGASREAGAWLHIDGAFGLWAAASPRLRGLVEGVELADSWATDAHKWLNVPYDSGVAIVAHSDAHHAAMNATAAYFVQGVDGCRDGFEWTPQASRRARVLPVWAALRSLGRRGVADLVERCCALAGDMAERLRALPGVEVLNRVSLNQILVRFHAPGQDANAVTRAVIAEVQREGVCWVGGTTRDGRVAMRVSICNWRTGQEDVDRSLRSMARALRAVS